MTTSLSVTSSLTDFSDDVDELRLSLAVDDLVSEVLAFGRGGLGLVDNGRGLLGRGLGLPGNLELRLPGVEALSSRPGGLRPKTKNTNVQLQ